MELWYEELKKQYIKSIGKIPSEKELEYYIKSREEIGEKYLEFLTQLKININDFRYAEIGKSGIDSLVKNFDTSIISPYVKSFDMYEDDRVIAGDIKVENGKVLLLYNDEDTYTNIEIDDDIMRMFLTQNPYFLKEIYDWKNMKSPGFIIGMYGKNSDLDKETKINFLKQMDANSDMLFTTAEKETKEEYFNVLIKDYSKTRK